MNQTNPVFGALLQAIGLSPCRHTTHPRKERQLKRRREKEIGRRRAHTRNARMNRRFRQAA